MSKNQLSNTCAMYFQRFLISKRYHIHYNSLLKHQQNSQKQKNANHNLSKTLSGWISYVRILQRVLHEHVFLEAEIIKGVQITLY